MLVIETAEMGCGVRTSGHCHKTVQCIDKHKTCPVITEWFVWYSPDCINEFQIRKRMYVQIFQDVVGSIQDHSCAAVLNGVSISGR